MTDTQQPNHRVLMIAPTSFFADYGCHVRILEEARALERLGNTIRIVTYYNGQDPEGLDIRRTWPIPWRERYEVGSSRHKLVFDAMLFLTAFKACLQFKPDIIHGHLHEGALIGGMLARIFRKPLLFDFQGSLSSEMVDHGFLNSAGLFFKPIRWLEKRIDHLPHAIVTSSHHAARHLREDFQVPGEKIHALPDCVNTQTFRPDLLSEEQKHQMRLDLGIPPERDLVIYLGLLAKHQGTELMLEAARRVVDEAPETHFLVMGFPGLDIYPSQAESLGLGSNITFTGRIPYQDAPKYLSLGDVAWAPKISRTEGSGKLMNYMAMALPTVAFDLPVSREYLRDDGVCVAPGNIEGFALETVALLKDSAGRRKMGLRLRQRAEADYDWARGGALLMRIYSAISARSRNASAKVET